MSLFKLSRSKSWILGFGAMLCVLWFLLISYFFKKSELQILYPFDDTLFPPEITLPKFMWVDEDSTSEKWRITFNFRDNQDAFVAYTDTTAWNPTQDEWESIKKRSVDEKVKIVIDGINTNIDLQKDIKNDGSFQAGGANIHYLEKKLEL